MLVFTGRAIRSLFTRDHNAGIFRPGEKGRAARWKFWRGISGVQLVTAWPLNAPAAINTRRRSETRVRLAQRRKTDRQRDNRTTHPGRETVRQTESQDESPPDVLRSWLVMVSVIAVGNTVQSLITASCQRSSTRARRSL
ncbi:unnamed protein product [Pleuronectes platessa]|uniref:Uncharacterized protein n=1 Tax=Pleuronectes platessa TaxID=8262 RepID=A0A9N7TV29_PLEPL|nr:unnamed protein product [Pleuronectes platessa]